MSIMNKHKKDYAKQVRLISIILVLSLALLIMLFFMVFSERNRLNMLYDQEVQDSLDSSYQSSRLSFCYENSLKPCTDEKITNWNSTHPDDQFSVIPSKLK